MAIAITVLEIFPLNLQTNIIARHRGGVYQIEHQQLYLEGGNTRGMNVTDMWRRTSRPINLLDYVVWNAWRVKLYITAGNSSM